MSKQQGSIVAGRRPVLELLKAGRPVERVLVAQGIKPSGVIGEIRRRAETAAVPVRVVPRAEVDRLAGALHHQGVVAMTGRFRYASLEQLLSGPSAAVLFCDSLTDPHNLGSLLRSADGAGFAGVVVPAHRSVGVTDAVRRVAAGAAEVVPVARVKSLGSALDQARSAGLWAVGLDAGASTSLWESQLLVPPVAVVVGAEDRGLSAGIRARCDELVCVPLTGKIRSLNAAVAGAVAMFEIARRREGNSEQARKLGPGSARL